MTAMADAAPFNGRKVTNDSSKAEAAAIAISGERILGRNEDVFPLATSSTGQIGLAGRHVIAGLIDSHIHIIRRGLNYNMELRWTACARSGTPWR